MSDYLLSPLHSKHEELGASFTPFGEWNMPLKYGSELEEHRAVRSAAGLFDLSHMGEIRVSGPDAAQFLDYALISHLSALAVGRAKYSMIVDEQGGIIDDLITYRLADNEYLVVPNAGNAQTVYKMLQERTTGFDVTLADESRDTALIAVQGPNSVDILLPLVPEEQHDTVRNMRYYASAPITIAGIPTLLARTGYTGEDGFEIYVPNDDAAAIWDAVLEAGSSKGLIPAGLAARDSLRLEAGMPLYGNELTHDLTPIAAGLGMLISPKKDSDFVGKEALSEAGTPARVLVGLESSGRRAARAHAVLYTPEGKEVGEVTSGQPSPTLGHPIALAYVDREFSAEGTPLEAEIRNKKYPFTVVKLPFYSRKK